MSKEKYTPSEEVLKECGFENCDYKSYVIKTKIGLIFYYVFDCQFLHSNQNLLKISSDSELKTFIKIIGGGK